MAIVPHVLAEGMDGHDHAELAGGPVGDFAVTVEVGLDATITISIDGTVVATGQAMGLIPHPPGRRIRETAGDLWIGMSGGGGNQELTGNVRTLTIDET